MKIGIDARFFGPIGKGLGRYTQKLIENLERVDAVNQYFIFLRSDNFDDYQPKNKNFQKVLADYRWYTWEEQIKFPWLLRKYRLDLMHFPHFNVPILYFGRFIVTIHDLILLHFPTRRGSTLSPFFYWFKFMAYRITIKSALYRSKHVIAVSQFTKKDILANYKNIPSKKIYVTYEACEDFCMLSPEKDKEILARYGIIKPYIMYVGNAYPHKNLERLVLAFEKVKEIIKNLKLVFVGNEDYFYRRLKKMVQERNTPDVIFVGFIPDYELDTVYHNVSAFVWPSLYEGFGLPPLEAMAKGSPVASNDHECMKEILGDSPEYFNGKDINDMARIIERVVNNENFKKELIKKGYRQVEKYSWKRMAQKTLSIYQDTKIK